MIRHLPEPEPVDVYVMDQDGSTKLYAKMASLYSRFGKEAPAPVHMTCTL